MQGQKINWLPGEDHSDLFSLKSRASLCVIGSGGGGGLSFFFFSFFCGLPKPRKKQTKG